MKVELMIAHGEALQFPPVLEGITWETSRAGSPSTLKFEVVQTENLQIEEGDAVRFQVDGKNVFYGFVFQQQRTKTETVTVTAYDQLRYLKNKDTLVYEGKTAADVIRIIAKNFSLSCGEMDTPGYTIPSRVEDDSTLFDMVQNALDLELMNTGKLFVLYDDFGKLTLKNIANRKLNCILDADTAEDFDYTTSIDSNTYNQIKITRENKGVREVFLAKDSGHINQWGLLQRTEKADEGENAKGKADSLLSLYNSKTKSLKIKNALGNLDCRAGTLPIVRLDLCDMVVMSHLLVEKATHTFQGDMHFMDLELRGGAFRA